MQIRRALRNCEKMLELSAQGRYQGRTCGKTYPPSIIRPKSKKKHAGRTTGNDMGNEIKTVGVVGAGQMGNGIAQVAAVAGYKVQLYDLSPERIEAALATVNGNLARQVVSGKL